MMEILTTTSTVKDSAMVIMLKLDIIDLLHHQVGETELKGRWVFFFGRKGGGRPGGHRKCALPNYNFHNEF
jgi:hypothetical protein